LICASNFDHVAHDCTAIDVATMPSLLSLHQQGFVCVLAAMEDAHSAKPSTSMQFNTKNAPPKRKQIWNLQISSYELATKVL